MVLDLALACDICHEPILGGPAGVWWVDWHNDDWTIREQKGPWFCHGSSYTGLLSCHFMLMVRIREHEANGGSACDIDLAEFLEQVAVNAHVQLNVPVVRAARLPTADISSCYLCLEQLAGSIEMDHVLPKSRGGSDSLLMPVHKECNRAKGNRPLIASAYREDKSPGTPRLMSPS
jgi:5-methylcytosine-specific restriction endonuclease McrA